MADRVWQALLESGRSVDLIPCGLGTRDTLRLEAAMRLYGNDIDESTTVLEAGLDWTVGWNKTDFIGRDRLEEQRGKGVARILVGLEMVDRGIARHGYPLVQEGRPIGVVTSGTQTPFLKRAIAMAYAPTELAAPGTEVDVEIRGRASKARVVPLPFYKRSR
jgi:aminomethyltransferase